MSQFAERRRYRRFEIPGSGVRHKRIVPPIRIQNFSKLHPLLNASIGGLALICEENFSHGEEVIIQLAVPKESPLNLHSTVRWQEPIALSNDIIVGFEFKGFGDNKNLNPPELLVVLRRLYARYIKK